MWRPSRAWVEGEWRERMERRERNGMAGKEGMEAKPGFSRESPASLPVAAWPTGLLKT
jgi:hypothetical protein